MSISVPNMMDSCEGVVVDLRNAEGSLFGFHDTTKQRDREHTIFKLILCNGNSNLKYKE